MHDLLYNLLVLSIDGCLIAWAVRTRCPWRVAPVLALATAAGLVLGQALALDLFHALRLLAYGCFVHAPLVLAGMAFAFMQRRPRWAAACACGTLLLGAAGIHAFRIEPTWLDVSRLQMESSKITRPLRIAVVSDVQTDRVGDFERSVVARIVGEEPDLILLTGDYIHAHDPDERDRAARDLRALLEESGLDAPLGVYAVRGNTEHDGWPTLFDGLPVTTFDETATVVTGELRLTGLALWDSFDTELRVPADDRFHIAFGHYPDFSLGQVEADLLLAGHTHGGQVRLPWLGPIITFSRVPRGWAAGVTRLDGDRTLVVSRGIGMERGRAPRMRFLCRPELIFIDVNPSSSLDAVHALADQR